MDIAALQKTRDNLLSSENQLRIANDKAEDLSIQRLTKGAPSVAAMLDGAKKTEKTPESSESAETAISTPVETKSKPETALENKHA